MNCNISQGVTLGQANRGDRERGAVDRGQRLHRAWRQGGWRCGSGLQRRHRRERRRYADVPDNAVVGGIPAKVISYDGSDGYVNRTDWPSVDDQ